MCLTFISIVQMQYIDDALHKLKLRTFYFTAMVPTMLETSKPLRQYQKSYKQGFGGYECFAMLMHTLHSATDANE